MMFLFHIFYALILYIQKGAWRDFMSISNIKIFSPIYSKLVS